MGNVERALRRSIGTVGANEVGVMFSCAVTDRDFVAIYEKQDGFLRFRECRRAETSGVGPVMIERAEIKKIDNKLRITCPWCKSTKNIIRCGSCKRNICGGTLEDTFFKCGVSCGGCGLIKVNAETFSDIAVVRGIGSGAVPPQGRPQAALPTRTPLMLGSGSGLSKYKG